MMFFAPLFEMREHHYRMLSLKGKGSLHVGWSVSSGLVNQVHSVQPISDV